MLRAACLLNYTLAARLLRSRDATTPATEDLRREHYGMGRELFAGFRALVGTADNGASVFG